MSASEDEVDSEFEDDVDDAEGPTLVTVDDGKGGVKHVKVSHCHHIKFSTLYFTHKCRQSFIGRQSTKIWDYFGIFPNMGGGVFPIPKAFVILP